MDHSLLSPFHSERRSCYWVWEADTSTNLLTAWQRSRDLHPPHVSIQASIVNTFLLYSSCVPKPKLLDAISSHVARILKEERERQEISLNLLSQRAGLSRQTISYVEQEVQNPTLDTLLRITSVLDMDLEKVIARARRRASRAKH